MPKTTDTYFTIITENKTYPITYEVLRGGWWNEGAYRAFTKDMNPFERAKDADKITKENFPDIFRIVENIAKDVKVKPYDGVIVFEPNSPDRFRVSGATTGKDLDKKSLYSDILAALKSGEHKTIHARLNTTLPKSKQQMTAKLGLRGGYTTYFEQNPNREHNIELALSKFNGLVVQNGQSVSFNQIVGKRSAERGFREAKIILDGEFVPGVGGGVCQASTTLFNALLLSGVSIDKSSSHSLAISYVPLGRDAMVSSATDLCFTNNTGGTVYIETAVTNATDSRSGHATVRIYGNKSKVKYKTRVETTECDLKPGELSPAQRASTYVDAYSGDRLVHTKLVRKSKYNAVKEKQD